MQSFFLQLALLFLLNLTWSFPKLRLILFKGTYSRLLILNSFLAFFNLSSKTSRVDIYSFSALEITVSDCSDVSSSAPSTASLRSSSCSTLASSFNFSVHLRSNSNCAFNVSISLAKLL